MSLRLACHWTVTTVAAAIASTLAVIPFTGTAAQAIGVLAAAGVCLIGIALAPNTTARKDRA